MRSGYEIKRQELKTSQVELRNDLVELAQILMVEHFTTKCLHLLGMFLATENRTHKCPEVPVPQPPSLLRRCQSFLHYGAEEAHRLKLTALL
jgi:hypothetical protein